MFRGRTGTSSAERSSYYRPLVEPLEARQLLSVSTLDWVIDEPNSGITLAIPDQSVTVPIDGANYAVIMRARNQTSNGSSGTWTTGNSTNFSGTLAIDYADGGQLQFKSGLNNFGELDQTNWRPNPGTTSPNPGYQVPGNPLSAYPNLHSNFTYTPNQSDGSGTFHDNTSAPAAFGARLNGTVTYPLVVLGFTIATPVTADFGYLSLSGLVNDAASGVLPISGGSFAANSTNLGVTGAQVALQGLSVAGITTVPSYLTTGQGLTAGTNTAPTGTITSTGTLTRKLTLPIAMPINLTGEGIPLSGTISGQLVATTTLTPPTLDLNGSEAGTGFYNAWDPGFGPVAATGSLAFAPDNAWLFSDTLNMAATRGITASLTTFHTGDVLAADTTGTNITQTFAGGTLTLSGIDTTANYEKVLQTITYDNTAGGPNQLSVSIRVIATDGANLTSAEADSVISLEGRPWPFVDLNGPIAGTGFSSLWTNMGAVAITDMSNAAVFYLGTDLSSMTVTLASVQPGDILSANTAGTAISQSYNNGTLSLSGSDTVADYQSVLRSITYNNTLGGPGVALETATIVANGGFFDSFPVTATITINTAPTVDLNGGTAGTGFTSQWDGSAAVAITDIANATVADDRGNLASMKVALGSPHTGDVLAANTTGTAITQTFAGGTLTLSGTDSVADYQTVLRSVTYNNTGGGPGVPVETATVVATDTGPGGALSSTAATATINMPAPTVALTVGAGSGTPNFSTSWYNSGSIPIENNIQASVSTLSGDSTLQSLTVALTTFHTGDVLSVPILTSVSITSSYAAGTLTLSGTDTLAHYQQELRFISYDNTASDPGVSPITATFVASDGVHSSTPVTATINVNVAGGEVLGNRLFYNNSKYDGGAGSGNAAINANDDLAIASDKTAFKGTGMATFANVSAFTKGITGIMVDLQAGLGSHSAINLTSGDITFKVAPTTFATTTYNQLSNWTAAPTATAISVRLGAGTGGSDRLEITWATNAIKATWLEVNVHSGGNTGLSADDVFYFGSSSANSSAGDTALLAKTDVSDYVAANNNIIGLTTPVWNLVDYSKDGKVDISDSNSAINNVFTLHYIGNPVGPFAPDSGGGSAAPAAIAAPSSSAVSTSVVTASASGAVSSGLSVLNGGAINTALGNLPNWLRASLQSVLSSPPMTKAIQNASHNPQVLQIVDQVASTFHLDEDELDGLLAELGLG